MWKERVLFLPTGGCSGSYCAGTGKGVANTIHFIRRNILHFCRCWNVATPEAVEFLAKAGADAVKSALDPDRFVPLVLLRELVLHNFLPF